MKRKGKEILEKYCLLLAKMDGDEPGFPLEEKRGAKRIAKGKDKMPQESSTSGRPTLFNRTRERFYNWAEGGGKPSLLLTSRILWYASSAPLFV
jgi:hypothetical protein